jgi:hypothetical protein
LAAGPYIAAESIHNLLGGHRAETTMIGIVLTAVALLARLAWQSTPASGDSS